MQTYFNTGANPLTPLVGRDGVNFVLARLLDSGTTAAKRAVQIRPGLDDGAVTWAVSATFEGGQHRFGFFGVTLRAGEQGEQVPVAIYGPVSGVTLPAAVTRTNTNTAIVQGGTRATPTAALAAGLPSADLARAEITDDTTGASAVRDLWLYGRDFEAYTLFKGTGRIRDTTSIPSISLLQSRNGAMYLNCRADVGVTKGRLTMFRRGVSERGSTWNAVALASGGPATAGADMVTMYGVPSEDVSAAAGAMARVQVVGWVEADLGAGVNILANNGLTYSGGAHTLGQSPYLYGTVLAIPEEPGNVRTRNIHLLGRVFHN